MRFGFVERKKIAFINGRIQMSSALLRKEYDNREIVNDLVLCWIVNAVSPQIASMLVHSKTHIRHGWILKGDTNRRTHLRLIK